MLKLDKSTWRRVKLGEVVKSSKGRVDPTSGEIDRYIAGEHMDSDDLRIHRWGEVGDKDLGPAFHRRFHPGQVLYGSRRTYLRKVSVAEFNGVCANTTFVLETSDKDALLQEFLPFVMTSEPFHAYAIAESKGSVNPYVNWSDIAKFEFGLPPLDEQKRIADLLWTVERHNESLQQVKKLIDPFKAFLMEVDVSDFDEVGNVVSIAKSGGTPKRGEPSNYDGSIPWLKSGEVSGVISETEESISDYGLKSSSAWIAPVGATVVAMYGATRGQVGRLAAPMATNQAVISLVSDGKKSDPNFLYYWMRSRQEELRIKGAGGAQKNLSKNLIVTEPYPNVSIENQKTAANNVAQIDSASDLIVHELATISETRNALLKSVFGDS